MGAPRRCLTAAGRLLAVGGCVSCCCSSSFLAPQTKRFKQPATSAGHMTGPMSAAARTPDGQVDPGWRGTPPPTTHVAAAERMSLAAVRGGCGGYVARRVGRRPRRRHATNLVRSSDLFRLQRSSYLFRLLFRLQQMGHWQTPEWPSGATTGTRVVHGTSLMRRRGRAGVPTGGTVTGGPVEALPRPARSLAG